MKRCIRALAVIVCHSALLFLRVGEGEGRGLCTVSMKVVTVKMTCVCETSVPRGVSVLSVCWCSSFPSFLVTSPHLVFDCSFDEIDSRWYVAFVFSFSNSLMSSVLRCCALASTVLCCMLVI